VSKVALQHHEEVSRFFRSENASGSKQKTLFGRLRPPLLKKKIWSYINYSSITSTIAVLISGTSAYFANFYEHRAVLLAIAPRPPSHMSAMKAKWGDSLTLTPIISNDGNHTEVIQSISIAVNYPGPTQARGTPAGPFVLKGGDAIAVPITFSFARMASPLRITFGGPPSSGASGEEAPTLPLEGDVYVRIVTLSPHNGLIAVDIPTSHIKLPAHAPALSGGAEEFEYMEQISERYNDGLIDIFSSTVSQFPYSGPFSGEAKAVIPITVAPAKPKP
jgi:hypothetical protein